MSSQCAVREGPTLCRVKPVVGDGGLRRPERIAVGLPSQIRSVHCVAQRQHHIDRQGRVGAGHTARRITDHDRICPGLRWLHV